MKEEERLFLVNPNIDFNFFCGKVLRLLPKFRYEKSAVKCADFLNFNYSTSCQANLAAPTMPA